MKDQIYIFKTQTSYSDRRFMSFRWCFLITIILCFHSLHAGTESSVGLWQGPHPQLDHIKFIIHLQKGQYHKIIGDGYWVDQDVVNSHFPIDSIWMNGDQIKIHINQWGCVYSGKINSGQTQMKGQFICTGEKPDSVILNKISPNRIYGLFPVHLNRKGRYQYQYTVPVDDNDGLSVGKMDSTTINGKILSQMIEEIGSGEYGKIHSILLQKNGILFSENYFYGFNRHVLHPVESVNKSITSLLVGFLIDQKKIGSVSQYITNFLQSHQTDYSKDLDRINLKHLLTMTSGISSDQNQILLNPDRADYLLNCTSDTLPGEKFSYTNWNTEMLGYIIHKISGQFADQFAEVHLFNPLGITNYKWGTYKNNGYPLCGGSLWLSPRDMIKIGQLVLGKGKWQEKQLISADWISKSTMEQVKTGIDQDGYGYQWWVSTVNSGNRNYRLIWANGLGSQFIFIFPDLEMVIAVTGGNWQGGDQGRTWDIFKMLKKSLNAGLCQI